MDSEEHYELFVPGCAALRVLRWWVFLALLVPCNLVGLYLLWAQNCAGHSLSPKGESRDWLIVVLLGTYLVLLALAPLLSSQVRQKYERPGRRCRDAGTFLMLCAAVGVVLLIWAALRLFNGAAS